MTKKINPNKHNNIIVTLLVTLRTYNINYVTCYFYVILQLYFMFAGNVMLNISYVTLRYHKSIFSDIVCIEFYCGNIRRANKATRFNSFFEELQT